MELVIKELTKKYTPSKIGLNNLSLTINTGILGLLGPNGAGKSTLMKIIATISQPSSGSIFLDGVHVQQTPDYIRKQLGYLPQDFGVFTNLNAIEFLEYIAAVKGVGGKGLKERILQLLEGVNLIESAKKPIGSYSGGMKQRVGIAQALLNDPKLLIFDEPTVGLDPEERVRFRQLISQLASDAIIILSSHIVSDIETIADQVAIMKAGELIVKDDLQTISELANGKVFEKELDHNEWQSFSKNFTIVNAVRKKNTIKARFLSDDHPMDAELVAATLEDAYLLLVKNRKHDGV